MITLPNSCYCSELKVIPKNWATTKASVKTDWILYYRFYDPQFKNDPKYQKGKLVRIKRMNKFTTLQGRQSETKLIMATELDQLKIGYNPIFGANAQLLPTELITTATPFLKALYEAERKIEGSKSTKRDLRSILNFISDAAKQLRLSQLPISTISRKHIKLLLSQIETNQEKESARRYNKIRSYLMILFNELVELEAIDGNPVREISKKQPIQPIRKLLSEKERKEIDTYLQTHHYQFWLFIHIFFHSGTRLTEIMQLKRKDVDLANQCFTVTIKKGKLFKQVAKPVKNVALPYWTQVLQTAQPDDFIFSKGLQPGPFAINTDQITKLWNRHIKKKLKINCDFYSLKHLNLDETAALLSLEDAAAMASHTSTTVTLKHYAVGEKQRQNDRLKKVNNTFS